MGLVAAVRKLFQGKATEAPMGLSEFFEFGGDYHIRELAFWGCVNRIANAVSKCEFRTFVNRKETKGPEYYLWNVAPNKNQSSSAFIHKWISQLYLHNECLIIEEGGQLLVADTFTRRSYALYDDIFENVSLGDFTFNKAFSQSQVLYFTLAEKDMRRVTAGLYDSWDRLIQYTMKAYQRSRGQRGTLSFDSRAPADTKFKERFEEVRTRDFKKFTSEDSAILPLYAGWTYTDLGSKTYSNEGTRDIRAMADDISDFTAKAFGIPPALVRGDVQGIADALQDFLTFCVDPLCDMLQEEINRKRNGHAVLDGTYLRIDTKSIEHVDLLRSSTQIDKLIGSGACSVNDILILAGDEPIDAEWAWKHYITKNYAEMEKYYKTFEGGEDNQTGNSEI